MSSSSPSPCLLAPHFPTSIYRVSSSNPTHIPPSDLSPPTATMDQAAAAAAAFPIKCEPSTSSSAPPLSPPYGGSGIGGGKFGGADDISCMPDFPPRRGGRHRRAQSEILVGLPDDLTFDGDLGVVGEGEYDDEGPSLSDDLFAMFLDADKFTEPTEAAPHPPLPPSARARHQHSQSMDGSTSAALGAAVAAEMPAEAKKAMSDAKLAELAQVDPKRAKRILANRQSAARSKERKMRYIAELERKVQTLQTEATTLSAQLAMLQRGTTGLTTENSELKLRLQTMEQQVRLQDALNDTLRDEIQQLKIATGQVTANTGKTGNFGLPSFGANLQSYQRSHIQSLLAAQQLQQLQVHSQQQQQQMHLQQQHESLVQQQQQLQEALPLPGDMKMKGVATTSHTPNRGTSDGHALKSET